MQAENYLYLQESGIDINTCKVEYNMISVRCEDLSLYRKAFRVKIRTLIKQNSMPELKRYVRQFYVFAQFAQYLYGFHSCSSPVEAWQEELACYLQTQFMKSNTQEYVPGSWMIYASTEKYMKSFQKQYKELHFSDNVDTSHGIQDEKPFLTPKDRAHFDRCFTNS